MQQEHALNQSKQGRAQPKFRPLGEELAIEEIKLLSDQFKVVSEALKTELEPTKRAGLMEMYANIIARLPSEVRKKFFAEEEERKRKAGLEDPIEKLQKLMAKERRSRFGGIQQDPKIKTFEGLDPELKRSLLDRVGRGINRYFRDFTIPENAENESVMF